MSVEPKAEPVVEISTKPVLEAEREQPAELLPEREQRPLPAVVDAKRPKHLWAPGKSANPSGRPKIQRDIVLLARRHTSEAIETLAEIMRSKRSPAAARVRAAEVLIDRGYGKAQQIVNVVQHVASAELEDLARRILLKREKRAAQVIEATVVETGHPAAQTESLSDKDKQR